MGNLIRLLLAFLTVLFLTIPTLAQVSYTWNGGDTLWSDTTAWTPTGLPGAGDTVLINSGKVTVDTLTEVAGLQLNGGILNADAPLSVTASMAWSGGTLEGSDTSHIEIPQGAVLHIHGNDAKTLDNALLLNSGAATWSDSGSIERLHRHIHAIERYCHYRCARRRNYFERGDLHQKRRFANIGYLCRFR